MENPLSVLVVDDTPGAADTVVEQFESAGFWAQGTQSADAALDAAEVFQPDVVVVEPLMDDAWEIVAWLRRRNGRGPALVALTRGPWYVADPRGAGVDYMVMKAGDPQALLAAVLLSTLLSDSRDDEFPR